MCPRGIHHMPGTFQGYALWPGAGASQSEGETAQEGKRGSLATGVCRVLERKTKKSEDELGLYFRDIVPREGRQMMYDSNAK